MNTTAKPESVVIVKLVAVNRPSGNSDFKRWKAAIPNMAGNAFGEPVPSFAKPYFVRESSDMVDLDEKITATFLDELNFLGFSKINFVM